MSHHLNVLLIFVSRHGMVQLVSRNCHNFFHITCCEAFSSHIPKFPNLSIILMCNNEKLEIMAQGEKDSMIRQSILIHCTHLIMNNYDHF